MDNYIEFSFDNSKIYIVIDFIDDVESFFNQVIVIFLYLLLIVWDEVFIFRMLGGDDFFENFEYCNVNFSFEDIFVNIFIKFNLEVNF